MPLQLRYLSEGIGLFVVILVSSYFLGSFQQQVLGLTTIFALAGIGLNVLVGYSGLVSLGHVTFFAIGAYGWARLAPVAPGPVVVLLPIVLSVIVAILIALVTLRIAGYYFAIVTLAVAMISTVVIVTATELTGGYSGISGILRSGLPGFEGAQQVIVTAALVLVIAYFFQATLRDSPLGHALLATSYDPVAAQSFGLSIGSIRMIVLAISSIPVTIAGMFAVQLVRYAGPDQFSLAVAIQLIAIPIIGGRGWRFAPILGSVVVIALPELFRGFADYRLVFYGAVLMLVGLFLPGGLRQLNPFSYLRRDRATPREELVRL
ncbi:hypothetical protein AU252_00900 [Pseudarthrobacter sulfonivorans]|uniref:Branched-chain amino acid ABC transporter permease n=1 Tax=Pseudarthrobacter sulfonivorans TaxID=121292 RepID=A0A0U3F7Q1_9MICC|nr:branched-chain amino acid ABC transporter permease [Pseudarthrobacter sulfonivorans]ALV39897.1 hypothetical protein AU252_00900 [Pseudarthrobacter sulfonivorans]